MLVERLLADLNPCAIERRILVLDRAHHHHVFEPL